MLSLDSKLLLMKRQICVTIERRSAGTTVPGLILPHGESLQLHGFPITPNRGAKFQQQPVRQPTRFVNDMPTPQITLYRLRFELGK
jgi:hypothetical protein